MLVLSGLNVEGECSHDCGEVLEYLDSTCAPARHWYFETFCDISTLGTLSGFKRM